MDKLKIKWLDEKAKLSKTHINDACWDAIAVSRKEYGDGRIEYGLGFSAELPKGTQLDLRSRSSIHKTGLVLSNGVGTGDEGYRGEYKAVFYHVLTNLPPYEVGDRVIQVQVNKRHPVILDTTEELADSSRGEGGFGSTGK